MFSIVFHWIVFALIVCSMNAQDPDSPSIPVHHDTSRDKDGINEDTEPIGTDGRGSLEARSQNDAAENNRIHGTNIKDFERSILEQHNSYRKQTCAEPLQTNEDLHGKAQQYAHALANGQPQSLTDDYGINIYEENTGDPVRTTAEKIVQSWYNQQESNTNFTQVIWKSTKEIGIGHAFSGTTLYVIILYRPRGNLLGKFTENVGCVSAVQANR